ncbi:MAG: hypothetical protein ABSC01_07080 [Verrucomicrobiota bacterium]|jgi:hypothetical protein
MTKTFLRKIKNRSQQVAQMQEDLEGYFDVLAAHKYSLGKKIYI